MKNRVLLFSFFCGALLGAAEYFVAPSGKDSNPGTRSAPFATVNKGAAALKPGDILTIRSGIYHESIALSQKGTPEKPVIIRGAAGERAVITGGYEVKTPWKKSEGFRFIWETPCTLSINMLWEKFNLDRFLPLDDLQMVEKSPGSFMLDKKAKKLYVHLLQSRSPETRGVVIVPWMDRDGKPYPVQTDTSKLYRFSKGIVISGTHITVDNLYVTFFPGQGIRFNLPGHSNTVSNCTVLGTTCGIMDYASKDNKILNNRLHRNAGTGIQLTASGARSIVEGNFMFNNGQCFQSSMGEEGSSGQIYNFSQYGGGFDGVTMRNNILVAYERRNLSGNTMRCKGGVRRFLEMSNNVFVNGGVELYARANSTGNVSCNTMTNGTYNIHKGLNDGSLYKVRHEDNIICKRDNKKSADFADESYFDYRLRKNSSFNGRGAYPEAGKGFAVVKNISELNKALTQKDIDTIYLEKGVYSGKIDCRGTKVRLRNADHSKVVLSKAVISGRGADFEGIIFKDSTLNMKGETLLQECVLDNCKAGFDSVLMRKTTLVSATVTAKKVIASETLLAGKNNKITGAEKLLENCAGIPALEADYRLPQGDKLAFAAFDCGAIGGRAAVVIPKKFAVENLEIKVLPPDRVRISCSTPNYYWRRAAISGGGLRGEAQQSSTGYKRTDISIVLRNLTPGKSYKTTLYVYQRGGKEEKLALPISFKVPGSYKPAPKTYVADSKNPLAEVLKKILPGDTVIVEPGTYRGGFTVDVDNVTIKSRIPGKAVLSAAALYSSTLTLRNVKNVKVEGFLFADATYSASDNCLNVNNGKNITIRNCYFPPAAKGGCSNNQLIARGVDGILIRDCIFNSGFQGIWLLSAKNVSIDHNTFYGIGINSAHVGGEQGDRISFTNNICFDVVGGHHSPAFSVAEFGKHVTCDYNLYWNKKCAKQEIFGFGRYKKDHPFSGTWDVMNKNMEKDLARVRSRFGLEKHGIFADPLFEDLKSFRLKANSPAKGAASDGSDLGARNMKWF